uniref:Uncharacterized protein n=1 Tax=Arundo donax TaxID=35708 RepID=A0A0A9AH54_ARUDO
MFGLSWINLSWPLYIKKRVLSDSHSSCRLVTHLQEYTGAQCQISCRPVTHLH